MFWIKKRTPNDTSGYLYLRETIYSRDRRTLMRKPKKFGTGKAFRERAKYSSKKDIYCGLIEKPSMVKFMTFKQFVEEELHHDFLEFKLDRAFDELIFSFVDYILVSYGLDKEEFFKNSPKKTYYVADGYLSPLIIDFLLRFNLKSQTNKELERFARRCKDACIFDDEIISALYAKLLPSKIEALDEDHENMKEKNYDTMMDFLQQGVEK